LAYFAAGSSLRSITPSMAGEYRLVMAVQKIHSFEFVDSLSIPGQIVTLKYTPTGEYNGAWSAEYSYTGPVVASLSCTEK